MASPRLRLYATYAYRILVLLALLLNAWLLHSIERRQYTGPTYEQEQRLENIGAMLEKMDRTLDAVEKNTRRY